MSVHAQCTSTTINNTINKTRNLKAQHKSKIIQPYNNSKHKPINLPTETLTNVKLRKFLIKQFQFFGFLGLVEFNDCKEVLLQTLFQIHTIVQIKFRSDKLLLGPVVSSPG